MQPKSPQGPAGALGPPERMQVMTTITLGIPIEPAALEVAQELQRRGAEGQLPLDLIAQALVHWISAEAENLLTDVTHYLNYNSAQSDRLVRSLNYAAGWRNTWPPLADLRDRRKAARTLARRHHLSVEPWMLWKVWEAQIGCNLCQTLGPAAPCWGQHECHGYANGCGCNQCATRARIALLSGQEA